MNDIANSIQEIEKNVNITEIRIKLIGTKRDTFELRENIDSLLEETRNLLASNRTLLDKQEFALSSSQDYMKFSTKRMSKTVDELYKKYTRLVMEFKDKMRTADSMKARQAAKDDDYQAGTSMQVQEQAQLLEIKHFNSMINDQSNEIENIETNVSILNEIFSNIGKIIREQGSIVDYIETNVQESQINTEAATNQLQQSNESARKYRNGKCWILFLLVFIVLILLVVFFIV